MIEGIKSHENWSDDATIRNSAKAITRIVGMGTLTVIADYENFTIWHRDINFTRSVGLWAISGGLSGSGIWVEAIRVLVIINRNFAVFYYHAFAWKSNDTLDDVLSLNGRIDTTS